MSQPFLGQIILFAGDFAPKGWAICDGSLLPIQQNTALFSILMTTYGGDGRTTFALPDLRGRAPVHTGASHGNGLSAYNLGDKGGTESVTLGVPQIPAHNHPVAVAANNSASPLRNPGGNVLGTGSNYNPPSAANGTLGGVSDGNTGGGAAHDNRQPFAACNFIIALAGVFPSRS